MIPDYMQGRYCCSNCGAKGVKLWRLGQEQPHTYQITLLCKECCDPSENVEALLIPGMTWGFYCSRADAESTEAGEASVDRWESLVNPKPEVVEQD